MPAPTEDQLQELGFWLLQYEAASEALKTTTEASVAGLYTGFSGWYEAAAIAAIAGQAVALSTVAQEQAAGLAAQYVQHTLAVLTGRAVVTPAPRPVPIRNGADLRLVHSRPAAQFRDVFARTGDEDRAAEIAERRATDLTRSDVLLAERQAEHDQLDRAGVKRYRRVIRPELSESGTCGLCVAASDRIYRTGKLMPIHAPTCKCRTMAIIVGLDAGRSLNEVDLAELYDAAGGTRRQDLGRARYKVREHGELGPVLTKASDDFRDETAAAVPLEQDPERAARMLDQVAPVLDQLEQRRAAGDDVDQALDYQRRLVDKLRTATAA